MDKRIIGKGRTATVYEYDDFKILKLFNAETTLDSIKKEAEIYKSLEKINLAPKVFSLEKFDDKYGLIMEKVSGQSMLNSIENQPLKASVFGKQMAQVHYQIHSFNHELPKTFNEIFDITKNLQTIGSNATRIKNYVNQLINIYPDMCVCHGDFHPDNIMLGKKVMVLDWTNAYTGHPLSDVAKTNLILSSPFIPEDIKGITRILLKFIKKKIKKSYLEEYIKLSNFSQTDIDLWTLPMAVVRLADNIPSEKKWLEKIIKSEVEKTKVY
ncbi:MAG: aminoglycoside phosphotransferase family protein [Halanaerobiales bacterium]